MDIGDDALLRLIQAWTGCGLHEALGLVETLVRYEKGEFPLEKVEKLYSLRSQDRIKEVVK